MLLVSQYVGQGPVPLEERGKQEGRWSGARMGSAVVPLNIRASDSFNKPYFRVSANHPDELRMKDLFLL